jgi:hypothetical protein
LDRRNIADRILRDEYGGDVCRCGDELGFEQSCIRGLNCQMEIVVVFAGQRFCRCVKPEQFERVSFGLDFRGWLANPLFEQHSKILLPNVKILKLI